MPQQENQTEEMLLLTCSPHITGYNLEQLAGLLAMPSRYAASQKIANKGIVLGK
jgi:hypothetical protein